MLAWLAAHGSKGHLEGTAGQQPGMHMQFLHAPPEGSVSERKRWAYVSSGSAPWLALVILYDE